MELPLARALVLALGLAAAATGCGTAHPGPAGPAPWSVGRSTAAPACPQGSALPPGDVEAVDYVDFFQFRSHFYVAYAGAPVKDTGPDSIRRVVTRVRCSLTTASDRRQPPPVVSGSAAFLRVGTPVYAVAGYPPGCRLAAYLGGRLHVYLAQRKGTSGPTPLPCAVRPTSSPRAAAG